MSLDPAVVRTLYQRGDMRPTGDWITCAAIDCDTPAAHDCVIRGEDGQVIFVPLCEPHIEVAPTTRIECEMTTHLFFGGPQ
jgi:hypothetical protein